MTKIEVGMILWSMVGRKRNKEIHWYAKPECVEEVTEHMYMMGDGTGCSHNSIGRNYFLSREEAISHFLKLHDSLVTESDYNESLPDNCYELPRTDWQDYEVVRFDGIRQTAVYLNGLDSLLNVTKQLTWHEENNDYLGDIEFLTLTEIHEQLAKDGHRPLITVIVNDPMRTAIYQCGNYKDGRWVKLGDVMGYA